MNNKGIVLSLVAALCLPLFGIAADLSPETQNGIRFLSGGIGMEERNAMQVEGKEYNLRLSFSLKGGPILPTSRSLSTRERNPWSKPIRADRSSTRNCRPASTG